MSMNPRLKLPVENVADLLAVDHAWKGEEFGEACAAINDGEDDWRLVQELIQVAAVAVKAIETLQAAWEESRKLEGISSGDC